jgi:hypothetical protein
MLVGLQETGRVYNLAWSTRIRGSSSRVKLSVLIAGNRTWEANVTSTSEWETKRVSFTATSSTLQLKFENQVYVVSDQTVFVDDILLQLVREHPDSSHKNTHT